MAYLSQKALEAMGFARLGRNVKISDKASIYEAEKMEIGDNSRIDDFCVVSGKIVMGRNVHIAPLCLVAGGNPGITFEDFSGLAYHVKVFSQSDDYSGATMTNPTVPSVYKAEVGKPVHLGRHCIVGAGAVLTPGVTLGEGTAVGALALVLKSTEPWTIYAGTPARRVKARSRDLLALERDYLGAEYEG
ncbi:acyltransferase [Sedimentitalea nanhaiensis]|uniref:Chloramphenicol acetyltransferase n=1 Tax=Sedimentitalea nanhaiensis TaxID=999627 RepID=A0A1I7DL54_9RHOB|nr:acyltransferase [Sedimentitalea nanhaiensis]SFU12390.1 galactoside O-acetyltransferase/dTDP-4-amino-4,6-dideoxygalactose transaminase [Sedimentitalea nanhaiensis]